MTAILELDSLTRVFGGLKAVDNVSTKVSEGELCGLIGTERGGVKPPYST